MRRPQRPKLAVDLVATSGFLNPTRRETDVAVLLARPRRGPLRTRKLTDYTLRLYASAEHLAAHGPVHGIADLMQAGRMPEPRLLLLAGLMLADRTSALEDRAASAERELARLKSNPQRVEVPVVPDSLAEAMAELAARAEALAQKAEDQQAG